MHIAATAALGGLLFGYDTGVISGALLFLKTAFHLTPLMMGVVTSIALAGLRAALPLQGGSRTGSDGGRFYWQRRSSSFQAPSSLRLPAISASFWQGA